MAVRSQRLRTGIQVCWLGTFGVLEFRDPMTACEGELVRCHLIPRQVLKKAGADVNDPRSWVWGCGGPTGIGGHHGMLDHSKQLRLPRASLPSGIEELAYEVGLTWWLTREYGSR